MANQQSQNGRGEYQIDEITYAKGSIRGRAVEKSVIRYVRT